MNRRKLLRGIYSALAAPALIRPLSALAYDAPTVRFNWVSGTGETTTWCWFNEAGVLQGTASGASGAGGIPTLPDPLTTLLQGALSYATTNGFNFMCTGAAYQPMQPNGTAGFLQTWSTISIPASGDSKIEFDNVIWIARPSTGDGIVFDSSELLDFEFRGGEILYRGASNAVVFRPTTQTVLDSNLSINSGKKIVLSSVTTQCGGPLMTVGSGTSDASILFDCTSGGVWGNDFEIGQLSGNKVANYGILVANPPSTGPQFTGNKIDVNYAMLCRAACIQIGTSSANAAAMSGNDWSVREIMPFSAACDGFNTFASYDEIKVLQIKGPMNRGLVLEPGTTQNRYRQPWINGTTAGGGIVDAGTGNVPQ